MSVKLQAFGLSDWSGKTICLANDQLHISTDNGSMILMEERLPYGWSGAGSTAPTINIKIGSQYLYVDLETKTLKVKKASSSDLKTHPFEFSPIYRAHNLISFHNNSAMAYLSSSMKAGEPLGLSSGEIKGPQSFQIHSMVLINSD